LGNTQTHPVAVLGGGITGLSAAYRLALARRAGAPIEEVLLEAGPRLGGLIRSEEVNGFIVEAGPDSFLSEKPEAAELCRALCLGESLIGSNDRDRRTYILQSDWLGRNRLVALPEGLVLFVPTKLRHALSTPLLPLSSKVVTLREWFKKAPPGAPVMPEPQESASELRKPPHGEGFTDFGADESAASFVARHYGQGMVDNIADPLLAGVFGGDSARLSARSVLPRFWDMEQRYGSLTRGVLQARSQRQNRGEPLFLTLKPGVETLVRALVSQLDGAGVHLRSRMTGIDRSEERRAAGRVHSPSTAGSYVLRREDGGTLEADAVILALPSFECARVLATLDPSLSRELGSITYTSAMTVALGYGTGVREKLPAGFGFLVPHGEKRRLLACTFVHKKFDHRVPPGCALLRCFFGGARDPGVLHLSDDEVIRLARQELAEILNLRVEPEFFRIYRWPSAMPQYEVGHAAGLRAIQKRLERHPRLFLAGNIYSGIGISDCIRTGQGAAERVLQALEIPRAGLRPCSANSL
jgi:protoporphyrinogen/coproporphyrinogen III oxidase